ncbi:MAG TPA: HigA family addiction module antitoxin [Blastocatellia bacterium]|nr:HigA family addiction module antitoxin [Blastocatellia bacterium]
MKVSGTRACRNSFSPAAAKILGLSRKHLSDVLHGRAGITPETALRISLAFGTSPESWLDHQRDYDLWRLQKKAKKLKVHRYRQGNSIAA